MTDGRTDERMNGGEIKGPFGFHPGPIRRTSYQKIKKFCFQNNPQSLKSTIKWIRLKMDLIA